jgi:hypothetical protein
MKNFEPLITITQKEYSQLKEYEKAFEQGEHIHVRISNTPYSSYVIIQSIKRDESIKNLALDYEVKVRRLQDKIKELKNPWYKFW